MSLKIFFEIVRTNMVDISGDFWIGVGLNPSTTTDNGFITRCSVVTEHIF